MEKEKKNAIRFNIMAVLLIVVFCIDISPVTLQNDTFYTIKIGEYILENGITMQEPFAWHENLEYTFPHWAYDVFIYTVYNIGGMLGIYISTIVLASLLGILIYFVNVKLVKNRIISFIISIIALALLNPYICARAQLVTFILFILTIYFIEKFLETKKLGYAIGLIIIPILIANLHVATFYFYFILYMPYIAEYGIYILSYANVIVSESAVDAIKKKIKKKGESEELLNKLDKAEKKYNKLKELQDGRMENPYKIKISCNQNIKWLIVIFIIALFTGLLTPLGNVPYTYLIKTMQGISTKNISEHLPITLINNMKVLLFMASFVIIIAFTKVKIRLSDLFMLAGLTFLTLMTRRQASMLILIGCIILNRLISDIMILYNKDTVKQLDKHMSNFIVIILISITMIGSSMFVLSKKKDHKFIDEKSYPVQAANWIKENLNLEEIKLYNEYNYGSYLLYQDIPVFVDSRCDLYMPEFNKDVNVFSDFLNLNGYNFTDMEAKIEEYEFTHFIVKNSTKLKLYLKEKEELYKQIYPTGEIEDKNFTIYERIK